MGGKFSDLDQYWDPGLTLTVLRKEYTLPLPSAELGLWCRRIAAVAGDISAATTEAEMTAAAARARTRATKLPELAGDLTFEELILGSVYQAMTIDEVPDPYIQFCAQTGYVWIVAGEQAAERFWTSGGRPEVPGPANREERRAQSRGRKSTAEATATRSRASTSGTRSPRKSSANTSAKAAASAGRKSSSTGG